MNTNYSDRLYHQTVNVQQPEVRTSVINPCRSPFANASIAETSKEPLSQLQELANVFSSPGICNRAADNDVKVRVTFDLFIPSVRRSDSVWFFRYLPAVPVFCSLKKKKKKKVESVC